MWWRACLWPQLWAHSLTSRGSSLKLLCSDLSGRIPILCDIPADLTVRAPGKSLSAREIQLLFLNISDSFLLLFTRPDDFLSVTLSPPVVRRWLSPLIN